MKSLIYIPAGIGHCISSSSGASLGQDNEQEPRYFDLKNRSVNKPVWIAFAQNRPGDYYMNKMNTTCWKYFFELFGSIFWTFLVFYFFKEFNRHPRIFLRFYFDTNKQFVTNFVCFFILKIFRGKILYPYSLKFHKHSFYNNRQKYSIQNPSKYQNE